MENVFIDVTVIEPRKKHPTIFEAFDSVPEGLSVIIHNDHDPKPLYYQLLGERGNCFSWTYLISGPEVWEVEIKKNAVKAETVGEIAAKDMRKAELLKKLGIDFCCGGKKSLEQACLDKGLDIVRVKQELDTAAKQPPRGGALHDFNGFNLSFLVDYIVNVHHSYIRQNAPLVEDLAHKVAAHHGQNQPQLIEVYRNFCMLRAELMIHMNNEEQILFPAIKQFDTGEINTSYIANLIETMENDHRAAGDIMRDIRRLTDDYTPATGSCNSVKMLHFKLEEFEADLLQHIHLENNILFPKVTSVE